MAMIHQIHTSNANVLAIEIIEGYTEKDEHLLESLFNEKLDQGYDRISLLVKLDELKISHLSIKAFMEDIIWQLRNFKKMGHLAIVAHSKIIKAWIPIDKIFFERASKGRLEQYFDVSQMEDAMAFVLADKGKKSVDDSTMT